MTELERERLRIVVKTGLVARLLLDCMTARAADEGQDHNLDYTFYYEAAKKGIQCIFDVYYETLPAAGLVMDTRNPGFSNDGQ